MPPFGQLTGGADFITAYTTELAPVVAGVVVELPPPPPLRHAVSNSAENGSALRINLVMVMFICIPVLWFATNIFVRFVLKVGTETCPPYVTSKAKQISKIKFQSPRL
jgi:hypothetical protein